MKRYYWVRLYALLLMIVLFAVSILVAAAGARGILSEAARQRGIVRGVQALSDAETILARRISDIAREAGAGQYERTAALAAGGGGSSLSEEDLEDTFRQGYCDAIRGAFGTDGEGLCAGLNSYLSGYAGVITVSDDPRTSFTRKRDAKGRLTKLAIENVTVCYDHPISGKRTDTVSFDIQFPDAVFHAGSDELFEYCMVSRKGIYITGRTSSIIGNVYAGSHKADECREAEVEYGETGTYGGINILSTQLGIKADRIVSGGDINANGSFVVISPADGRLECFGQRINEREGFSKDARVTLNGTFHQIGVMGKKDPEAYTETVKLVDTSLSRLSQIEIYYDSDNDGGYSQRYRKLMSASDIEIRHDFTGIIATPGNVIVHNDVNIEGIILCGDRIYTMGNNNIVANPAVAREIIGGEFAGAYGMRAGDFIGGMKKAGLTEPEYYVLPYK